MKNEVRRAAEEPNFEMTRVPSIWLGYDSRINEKQFRLLNEMTGWWAEGREHLLFLKSEELPYLSLVASICYPEADIQQLVGLTISLGK